jgi:hypothetical protein
VVLSYDTSSCWCRVVTSPPSDAVPALLLLLCVCRRPERAAMCLFYYVSAVKRRRVAVLHVCPGPSQRHSLAACRCCPPSACLHVHCIAVVTVAF